MTSLLAASTGGHLVEMLHLAKRIPDLASRSLWVTHDDEQSRSLLADEVCEFLPAMNQKAALTVARSLRAVNAILNRYDVEQVVSTGAAIALAIIPVARKRGIPCYYFESATRVHDLALVGRIIDRIPGVHRFHQHSPDFKRWEHRGSLFDPYASEPVPGRDIKRIVVTVGTQSNYEFRRLFEQLVRVIPAGIDVLWQTGSTNVSDLPIDATPWLPARELQAAIDSADAVIAHCGVGTALSCYDAGQLPLFVPRNKRRAEHVDNHQQDLATYLQGRGLAGVVPDDQVVTWDRIVETTRWKIRKWPAAPIRLSALDGAEAIDLVGAVDLVETVEAVDLTRISGGAIDIERSSGERESTPQSRHRTGPRLAAPARSVAPAGEVAAEATDGRTLD